MTNQDWFYISEYPNTGGNIAMSNKVSIFITNSDGKHFELSNEKMAIMMACDHSTNWSAVFKEPVSPYDIIISDFHSSRMNTYYLVQHCDSKQQAETIIKECRGKLHDQYERMMMIRVAKKYDLSENARLAIEMQYPDSDNYEMKIKT